MHAVDWLRKREVGTFNEPESLQSSTKVFDAQHRTCYICRLQTANLTQSVGYSTDDERHGRLCRARSLIWSPKE